jgi:hypothetical protein
MTRLLIGILACFFHSAGAFSANSGGAGDASSSSAFALFDRFRATCPADPTCIRQFDSSLPDKDLFGENDNNIWVAVYRSSNNKPSVFVRDEFLGAMRSATTATSTSNADIDQQSPSPVSTSASFGISDKFEPKVTLEKPVAVVRLRPSDDFKDKWVLDSLRCILKKEDMDESCDGGSEFLEAISVGVDALLLHHLQTSASRANTGGGGGVPLLLPFEGSIRTKATLFSHKILMERGFEEVQELSKDMATHVSNFEACMEKYAERAVSTVSKNPGARDRALQILSLLGKLDPDLEASAVVSAQQANIHASADGEQDESDYDDMWAGMKKFNQQ